VLGVRKSTAIMHSAAEKTSQIQDVLITYFYSITFLEPRLDVLRAKSSGANP